MKAFRKRTLALVLASVVTVVGSFAADNYKNSLMGLKFSGTNGSINMTVQTKSTYEGNVTPIRKSANTYTLILPDMDSHAVSPDLRNVSSDIASVNISTMPYSNNAKGYTKITIKTTSSNTNLTTDTQIFVGKSFNINQVETKSNKNIVKTTTSEPTIQTTKVPQPKKKKIGKIEEIEEIEEEQSKTTGLIETPVPVESATQKVSTGLIETPYVPPENSTRQSRSASDNAFIWLWAILIVLVSAFFYAKAKTKIQDLVGESLDINVNDTPEKNKKEKKINKIKKTINSLDSTYPKTSVIPGKTEYTVPPKPAKTIKPAEELNVVDLDELFQEHKSKNTQVTEPEVNEENDALEDFLSGFSFDDSEIEISEEENSVGYDEEYYEKTINDSSLIFSKDEVNCINQLLNTEINDETLRNIEQYAISNPIQIKPSKEKILENFVTSYSISQNISFSNEDVNALYKLISVELDNDFITDLKTNPQRTAEMEKDILAYGDKPKKPSEIITLSVKDMLPDLSEALKKQGNKKIESNRKAETIYYSEGYEVSTLSLDSELPDLSIEINKKDSYKSKPSAEYEVVDSSYVVGDSLLKIDSELPDLKDVMAHPEKYEQSKKEEVIANEEELLKNISNVQFKPFYDCTEEFEVLNNMSEVPSMSDIQQELSQFEGFEIAPEENFEQNSIQDEYDDFQSLYNNEYVDLDKENSSNEKLDNKIEFVKKENKTSAQELMKKIEETKIEREKRKARLVKKETVKNIKNNDNFKPIHNETIRCILNGRTYTVVSSAEIDNNMGCHLAKNEDGYAILGYIDNKLITIKQYETLKSERIHVRLSEKLSEDISRYIVRIGIQKFIINVSADNIEFVMDLC